MDWSELVDWVERIGGLEKWQDRAACADHDTDAFFTDSRKQEAMTVCSECEVETECLVFAIETNSIGVWGKTNTYERRHILEEEMGSDPVNPIKLELT